MLTTLIEALIFASPDITYDTIVERFAGQFSEEEVKKSLEELTKRYNHGVILFSYNNCYRFQTNPVYDKEIANILLDTKEKPMSEKTLQTLTVIAYRQPITRTELEQIRGVSCEYAINVLLRAGLISNAGKRDTAGNPTVFITTPIFLQLFGLHDLSELPQYEQTLDKIRLLTPAKRKKSAKKTAVKNAYYLRDEQFYSDENIRNALKLTEGLPTDSDTGDGNK